MPNITQYRKDLENHRTSFQIVIDEIKNSFREMKLNPSNESIVNKYEQDRNNLNDVFQELFLLENKIQGYYNGVNSTFHKNDRELDKLKEEYKSLHSRWSELKNSNNASDERYENSEFIFRRNMYIYAIYLVGIVAISSILIKLYRE